MEKRMESVKKQADAVAELERELGKAVADSNDYRAALTSVGEDLEKAEMELGKLRQNAAASEKAGAQHVDLAWFDLLLTSRLSFAGAASAPGEGETVAYEGSMETSYLIQQIDSLRGAVRFLRSENSYIKSQDLLAELDDLPSYTAPRPQPSPPREPTGLPAARSANPPPLSFATQSKLLLREARLISSTPRLVDLSLVKVGGKPGWQPSARAPRNQLLAEKERSRALSRKVQQLWEMRQTMVSV